MRGTTARPITRLFLSTLGACFLLGATATAAPIQETIHYSTSIAIGGLGITGKPVVGFQGVTDGTVTTPTPYTPGMNLNPIPAGYGSDVPIGYFTLTTPANGSSTTYDNTPFSLTFRVNSPSNDPAVPILSSSGISPSSAAPTSFTIDGTLNGTVSSSQPSTLHATFTLYGLADSQYPEGVVGGFQTGPLQNLLTIPFSGSSIPIGTMFDALPELSGVLISTMEVPEPASGVLFALLALGLVRRHYRSRLSRRLVLQPQHGEIERVARG
jgi:hypothetical protein